MGIDRMNELAREVYKILHRFHQAKLKFRGDGELANVEFFMLISISAMLDTKNGRLLSGEKLGTENSSNGKELVSGKKEEQGVTLGEIIRATDMSMSAASKKVSILEKKGLIERHASKTDRRNVYITLTEKEKVICEQAKAKKRAWIEELVKRMGREDMKQLLVLANRAFEIMDEVVNEQQESSDER